MTEYGHAPETVGVYDLDFTEYMHYMYLPVSLPDSRGVIALPPRLEFARKMITDAIVMERIEKRTEWAYIYVTARRGYATPGNPLNRPGWHADGFGTEDINYVWTDAFPTLFAEQRFESISAEHGASMTQFEAQIAAGFVTTYPDRTLLRLDPFVIHAAPEIPTPGGERSFFKVSFSNDRYNLIGNSHNHLLDYDWPMYSREQLRNDPARAGSDGPGARS